jgi:hypothetical protein
MARFIKLTNRLLNTNYIHTISIKPNKYYIHHFEGINFEGSIFLFAGSGGGNVSSINNTKIEICETKNPTDYKIISNWINNH